MGMFWRGNPVPAVWVVEAKGGVQWQRSRGFKLFQMRYQRRLDSSPTGRHENLKLQLSRLGNPRTVRALHDVVKQKVPSLAFLMETKLHKDEMERVKFRLGFNHGLFHEAHNRSGGLALLWRIGMEIEVLSYSGNHMDAFVLEAGVACWRITGFYGHPEVALRKLSWELLGVLHSHSALPWLCVGDFNEIIAVGEKYGRVPRAE
ncbi:hypothetical protein L1049_019721 [Liquidambar formosana]|uniref:Endonuclease/exonuclease/phosphatase domain-containing protein n=1 Tax=Liquidambar formosana TaxID=63359 RepID=A0AAP0S6L8_LIQFO